MVPDLTTQWIQSYLCKNKNSQETEQKPKVIHTDNSFKFSKCCEELSWNHRTSTPYQSETNGFAERAVRRVKEGRKFGESFKGPIIPLGALVEYLPNSERDQARSHQFGKKALPGIFQGCALIAGGIWKGDILVADIEELEKLDASEIYPRRLNPKEVRTTHKDWEFVFLVADGSATLSGRDYEFQEATLRREHTVKRENLSGEFQGDREEFQPEETKDDAETQKDFWSIQGDFIYRPHIEPRVHLHVPKEESFPILLKYIDVIRSTHTDLDRRKPKSVGVVNWFHEIHIIERNSSKRICVVRGETDKNPNDITPRSHMA